jgi:hypothetical protein
MRLLFGDDDDVWKECMCTIDMSPILLRTVINTDDAPRDFIIASKLFRDGRVDVCGQLLMSMSGFSFEDEGGAPKEFAYHFITSSLDIEILRFGMLYDEDDQTFGDLKESAS